MLPIPRNRIIALKKKVDEQTKSNDQKDKNALNTTKYSEKEEKSVLKKNNETKSRNRVSPKEAKSLAEKVASDVLST